MSFNYNLLKPLCCLLETRSINNTAIQLNTSASAVSRTLRSLREIFKDDLLIRKNGQMVLTSKGDELREKVIHLVADLESLTQNNSIDPLTLNRHVVIAMNASIAQWFAPILLEHLAKQAPNLSFSIEDWHDTTPQSISNARVDYGIHYFPLDLPKNLIQKRGEKDSFVLACHSLHPLAGKDIVAEEVNRYPLAIHTMKYWNDTQDHLSQHLKKKGIEVKIGLRTAHLSVLLKALKFSEFLFPCSKYLANSLGPSFSYLTSNDHAFEALRQKEFGFLYDNTKRNDPLINWLHNEVSSLMRRTIQINEECLV
ncbi:LysR family transcriptional regulator [Vibrio owensii]|uniref:Transcriptional regulator n=1 Tax=Vibrio owensii CAIM 1854 = LMG 25443 TaxID=1229493 RepID=A0A0C1VW83_9VIBR|nr:LysR family transcriptional regulator [Vibrio owensii]KIF54348.1 transcriptional regulator [Vibrio owensii CAIM 1854 = LMG 25443]